MTVDSSCGTAAEKGKGAEERSPDRWMVVLLNDDYTPFDWVIDVLIRIFERTPGDAMAVTRSVHQQGRGIAGVYPRVKALRLVAKLHERGPQRRLSLHLHCRARRGRRPFPLTVRSCL